MAVYSADVITVGTRVVGWLLSLKKPKLRLVDREANLYFPVVMVLSTDTSYCSFLSKLPSTLL